MNKVARVLTKHFFQVLSHASDKQLAVIAAASVVAIVCMGLWLKEKKCAWDWEGFETKYTLASGCKVRIEEKLVPEANVRQF